MYECVHTGLAEKNSVWTGLKDDEEEGTWEWNSGDPEMAYMNWDVGQPGTLTS